MNQRLDTLESQMNQRFDKIEERLNSTFEHVGQLTVDVREIRNSTDYIKHKITDHDEKLYLLNKKTN